MFALRKREAVLSAFVSMLGLAACGGPPAKTAEDEAAKKARQEESIGALAASQGGLASLGGGANANGSGYESALTGPLRAELVEKDSPVKVDGLLKEWQARTPAKNVRGATDGVTFQAALQYDDTKLYLAGEVEDPKYVRTARFGENEDRASLALAFPGAGGQYKVYELSIYPGKAGETAGSVRYANGPSKGREVAGAKVVEAPNGKGSFTFEAVIPWGTFAEARTLRVGLRAAVRYHDGDGKSERGVLATSAGGESAPNELSALPTAAERAVVEGLLEPKGMASEVPKIELFADVAGDAMKERVSVFDKYFTVCGPGYRGGKQFFYRELTGEVTKLEARDVSGKGKDSLLVRRKITHGGSVHEAFEVWTFAKDEPETSFSHVVSVSSGGKRVSNALRVSQGEIEVTVEPAVGWDGSTYREPGVADTEALLLPWGTVKSRVFRFDGTKFSKASEVAQAGQKSEGPGAPKVTSSEPTPRDVPTPAVRSGGDLSARVYEQYLKDQSVASGTRPKVDLQVQVNGDARPERVVVIGRDLVVLGPGYKGGTQYAYARLTEFAAPEDISEVTARDITGDGLAEIVVRGKTKLAPTVDSEVMILYSASGERVTRLLGVETAREAQGSRIQGLVQFVPSKTKGFEIDVRPGTARGFTEKNCPFPEGEVTAQGVPVLLPWGKTKSLRMVWNGTAFVKQ
jgi:hypothetical protein